MEFTTSPSASFDFGENALSAPEGLNLLPAPEPLCEAVLDVEVVQKSQQDEIQNSSSSSDSIGENLHALPLYVFLFFFFYLAFLKFYFLFIDRSYWNNKK